MRCSTTSRNHQQQITRRMMPMARTLSKTPENWTAMAYCCALMIPSARWSPFGDRQRSSFARSRSSCLPAGTLCNPRTACPSPSSRISVPQLCCGHCAATSTRALQRHSVSPETVKWPSSESKLHLSSRFSSRLLLLVSAWNRRCSAAYRVTFGFVSRRAAMFFVRAWWVRGSAGRPRTEELGPRLRDWRMRVKVSRSSFRENLPRLISRHLHSSGNGPRRDVPTLLWAGI